MSKTFLPQLSPLKAENANGNNVYQYITLRLHDALFCYDTDVSHDNAHCANGLTPPNTELCSNDLHGPFRLTSLLCATGMRQNVVVKWRSPLNDKYTTSLNMYTRKPHTSRGSRGWEPLARCLRSWFPAPGTPRCVQCPHIHVEGRL